MPNKTQTEATLADLAIGIVSEKLPELLNFLFGFELITANDDRTKAAGILGFKIGEELVYMPILFLSGKIKGNEILYLKNSDVFTSASKPWVDYLTSRSPGAMGKGTQKPVLPQPSAQDMEIFHRTPNIGKTGSLKIDKDLFEGAANQFWDGIANGNLEELNQLKRAEFNGLNVLRSFGPRGQIQFMEMLANEFPEVVQKMADAYNLEEWTQFDQVADFDPAKLVKGAMKVGVRALGIDCELDLTPAAHSIATDMTIEAPAKVAFLTAGGWLRKCAYRGQASIITNLTPGADLFPVDVMAKIASPTVPAVGIAHSLRPAPLGVDSSAPVGEGTGVPAAGGSMTTAKSSTPKASTTTSTSSSGTGKTAEVGDYISGQPSIGSGVMAPEPEPLNFGAPHDPNRVGPTPENLARVQAGQPMSSGTPAAPAAPSWWDQNGGALTKGLAVGAGALGAYGAYRAWQNRKKDQAPKVAQLAIVDADAVFDGTVAGLDDNQKTAAIRDGFVVIDRRPAYGTTKLAAEKYVTDHETAELDPIERYSVRLDTPRESGFYEILNSRGNMRRVFLGINPFVVESPTYGHPAQIVVDPESGRFHKVRAFENTFATGRLSIDESKWKDSYGSMPGVKSMKPDKVYMLIDSNQRVSAPFRVTSKSGSGGNIDFLVTTLWEFFYSCSCDCDCPPNGRALKVVDGDKFTAVTRVGDFVFVPSDCKVLEIDDSYADTDSKKKIDREIKPGTDSTVTAAMMTADMFKLRIEKQPGGEKVKLTAGDAQSDDMDSKTAAIVLTAKLRLPAGPAIDALREAFNKGASMRCVRGYSRLGMSIPKVADDLTVPVDQVGTGQPLVYEDGMMGAHPSGFLEQQSFTDRVPLDLNDLRTPDQDWRDNDQANWDRIQPKEVSLLERALQAGHNPVFDSAMIGVLLRSSRASAQVAQWLPDLVNALDTKCRLLLLFYWHNDDFAQDYGKDELAEFEDTLLDSIKRDGQLVLFLKQKSGESASVKIDALAEE